MKVPIIRLCQRDQEYLSNLAHPAPEIGLVETDDSMPIEELVRQIEELRYANDAVAHIEEYLAKEDNPEPSKEKVRSLLEQWRNLAEAGGINNPENGVLELRLLS